MQDIDLFCLDGYSGIWSYKITRLVQLVLANSGAASISPVCQQTSDRMNMDIVFAIADRFTATNNKKCNYYENINEST